jgi:hypothetical protein
MHEYEVECSTTGQVAGLDKSVPCFRSVSDIQSSEGLRPPFLAFSTMEGWTLWHPSPFSAPIPRAQENMDGTQFPYLAGTCEGGYLISLSSGRVTPDYGEHWRLRAGGQLILFTVCSR